MFKFIVKILVVSSITFLISACGGGGTSTDTSAALTITKPKTPIVILIFGDSISQGYGVNKDGITYQQISPGNTYAELLRVRIKAEKLDEFAPVTVINESLGSEFTDDAVARLPDLLAYYRPTHVLLAHGTNDAASDEPFDYIANNFITMINMAKSAGAKVLLADVTFTRYGPEFAASYTKMITDTAFRLAAIYAPLLKDIAGNSKYYLSDQVHLNDAAQNLMLNNLWEKLIPTIN